MEIYDELLNRFTEQSRQILGERLAGIYLHGSAVMGCFHPKHSDIDLLVAVRSAPTEEEKRRYMDMVVDCNADAPPGGIEMSIVRKAVCRPFLYPTPFELHFSAAHLEWYRTDPEDYVKRMNGTDPDLAAHITILYHRGRTLCGEAIRDVFEEVAPRFYFDSIRKDIACAKEDILKNPVYITLNLCRVWAYGKEGLILSKAEGGKWGLEHVPAKYRPLIRQALDEYTSNQAMESEPGEAVEFAAYMTERIFNCSSDPNHGAL